MADEAIPARSSHGALAVTLVFALGVIFGAALSVVLLRVGGGLPRRFGGEAPLPPPGGGIGRVARELDLDADQREEVRAILGRTHGSIRQTLDAAHHEIRALLRPDQQERFDRMRPLDRDLPHRGPMQAPPGGGRPFGRRGPPPPSPPPSPPPNP